MLGLGLANDAYANGSPRLRHVVQGDALQEELQTLREELQESQQKEVGRCCCCCFDCCNVRHDDGVQVLLLEAYEQLEAGQQEQLESAIKQQLGAVEHLQQQQAVREHALQRERERHQVLDASLRLAQQESAEATAQRKVHPRCTCIAHVTMRRTAMQVSER